MADRLQVNVRMEEDLYRCIEEFRRKQDTIPTRSDAIKKILREALGCSN